MLNRLRFSFSYALRNINRERQRTLFAVFSIAAGVATVVALRMLGLMLTDALTSNVQALNRGDVVVSAGGGGGLRLSGVSNNPPSNSTGDGSDTSGNAGGSGGTSGTSGTQNRSLINAKTLPNIRAWAEKNSAELNFVLNGDLSQAASVKDAKAGRPAFTQIFFIDPANYPFYEEIRADDPPNAKLTDLLTGPNQTVIGARMATELNVKVGDTIRLGTAKELQTVKGIVPDTSEGLASPISLIFGFVYVDRQYADAFGLDPQAADKVYIKLPAGKTVDTVELLSAWDLSGGVNITTTAQTLERNQTVADLVSRFVLLLSLVALVIGGVGIVNTMLVAVNRRAPEIAVLKTIGLKGRGVLVLFLSESILIGILGSLVGCVLGVGLSLIARQFGEQAFNIPLPFVLRLEPFVLGIALGLTFTVIFSILPILMAMGVRPAMVLRQGSALVGRAGCLPTLISLAVLIIGIGLLIDAIIGNPFEALSNVPARGRGGAAFRSAIASTGSFNFSAGILTTLIVFAVLGLFVALMWFFVWLLGKLPSFRNANLRLAIRGLTLYRGRTAFSLLALVVGMSALSGTLILSRSVNQLLSATLSGPFGGNVVVLPLVPLTDGLVRNGLSKQAGVNGYRDVKLVNSTLLAVNGDTTGITTLRQQNIATSGIGAYETFFARYALVVGMKVYGTPDRNKLLEGRYLTDADAGKKVMVIPDDPALAVLGITLGSKLTYEIDNTNTIFEVVGITEPGIQEGFIPFSLGDTAVHVPIDSVPSVLPFNLIIADVQKDSVSDAMATVGAVPGTIVFDVGVFDTIINRFLSQLAALPLLVAGLSLFAATILIATTVSLATLERRRQVGILKALGVKRGQVLSQLLIENGLVGLLGGLIAIIPTMLILAVVPAVTQNFIKLPVPYDLIGLMLVLSIAITLGATILSAWGAASEKPLQVLRYE